MLYHIGCNMISLLIIWYSVDGLESVEGGGLSAKFVRASKAVCQHSVYCIYQLAIVWENVERTKELSFLARLMGTFSLYSCSSLWVGTDNSQSAVSPEISASCFSPVVEN